MKHREIYISACIIIRVASAGKVLAFETAQSRRSSFSFSLFVPKLERAYHLDWNKFICFELCSRLEEKQPKSRQRAAAADDVICLNWKWKCDVSGSCIRARLNNNYLDWRRVSLINFRCFSPNCECVQALDFICIQIRTTTAASS